MATSLLVAVSLLVVLWLCQPEVHVRPDQFDRIRLGMSQVEVEEALRLKAGYMAYDGAPHHTLITQDGPDMEPERMLHWCGKTHSIFVWLGDDGRIACRSLTKTEWTGTETTSRVWRWLGWHDITK
jgi:hypothetical protein